MENPIKMDDLGTPIFGWWWFQAICLIFTPILGEDFHFDDHIFQMGWNHQPD